MIKPKPRVSANGHRGVNVKKNQ